MQMVQTFVAALALWIDELDEAIVNGLDDTVGVEEPNHYSARVSLESAGFTTGGFPCGNDATLAEALHVRKQRIVAHMIGMTAQGKYTIDSMLTLFQTLGGLREYRRRTVRAEKSVASRTAKTIAKSVFRNELRFLKCPISQSVFTDPIILPCGHTYEKAMILRMRQRHECPECRVPFTNNPVAFTTNYAIKSAVDWFRKLPKKIRDQIVSGDD